MCGNTEATLHQPRVAFLHFSFLALRFSLTLAASARTFHNQPVRNRLKEIRLLGPKKNQIFFRVHSQYSTSLGVRNKREWQEKQLSRGNPAAPDTSYVNGEIMYACRRSWMKRHSSWPVWSLHLQEAGDYKRLMAPTQLTNLATCSLCLCVYMLKYCLVLVKQIKPLQTEMRQNKDVIDRRAATKAAGHTVERCIYKRQVSEGQEIYFHPNY